MLEINQSCSRTFLFRFNEAKALLLEVVPED
jgi:hypothetical protein